ncbi:MAG: hypothetical protein RIC52_13565 [Amphiplicatus sp.]
MKNRRGKLPRRLLPDGSSGGLESDGGFEGALFVGVEPAHLVDEV